MIKYLQLTAVIAFISMGFVMKILVNQKKVLQRELSVLEQQEETTKKNLLLTVQQLDREIEYRLLAENALNDLMKEVPDVVYSQQLPPEIQGILDRFHQRIRP